jgi:hypothetical protein
MRRRRWRSWYMMHRDRVCGQSFVAAFDERWTSTLNAPYLSRNSNHIRKEKSKEASAYLVLSRVIITFSLFERFQTIISRSITTRWLVAAVVSWGTDGPSYLTTSAVAACAAPFVWLTLGGVVGTDGSLTPGRWWSAVHSIDWGERSSQPILKMDEPVCLKFSRRNFKILRARLEQETEENHFFKEGHPALRVWFQKTNCRMFENSLPTIV